MFQFIYDQSIAKNTYRWHVFNLIRIRLSKYFDPAVRYTLHGNRISLPFSHSLPIQLKNHPLYSANLTRLAGFLRVQDGHLKMIDVGANIGDSFFSVDHRSGDSYLLIEGEEKFFAFLTANTRHDPSVAREQALLMEKESRTKDVLVIRQGNASLELASPKSAGSLTVCTTLERVLKSHPQFGNSNLLKVDVEGYDGRVLRGGRKFLSKTKPVIFFEHHPRKIAALGDDTLVIFRELAKLGYRSHIVYDNLGFLLGVFPSAIPDRIDDLVWYGRNKGIYFDICCFHDGRKKLQERFLEEERSFYRKSL